MHFVQNGDYFTKSDKISTCLNLIISEQAAARGGNCDMVIVYFKNSIYAVTHYRFLQVLAKTKMAIAIVNI